MASAICELVIFGLLLIGIQAVSNKDANGQNTITEEERRGASPEDGNKLKKGDSEKGTRGAYSSATHKHQHYYYPGEYDSHVSSTGQALLGLNLGGGGGHGHGGGGGHEGGTASGYSYQNPGHSGPSGGGHHGGTAYGSGGGAGPDSGYGGYGGYSGHGGYSGGGGHGYGGYGGQGGHHGGRPYGHGGILGHDGYNSAMALKGLLIPLAGIALLGAAAALSTNPVLLQLGVVGGRKKRSIVEKYSTYYPANPQVRPDNL